MANRNTAIIAVARNLLDNTDPPLNQLLTDVEIGQQVDAAVKHYSNARPNYGIWEQVGDGSTTEWAVQTEMTDWIKDFSFIESVEYPTGNRPRTFLEEEDWEIYERLESTVPTLYFLLNLDTPTASDTLRARYNILHTLTASDTTIPDTDHQAVEMLATSFCCGVLGTDASAASEATISADAVNKRDSQLRFNQEAKAWAERYYGFMGIDPNDMVEAAGVNSDIDISPAWPGTLASGGFLTHSRRNR